MNTLCQKTCLSYVELFALSDFLGYLLISLDLKRYPNKTDPVDICTCLRISRRILRCRIDVYPCSEMQPAMQNGVRFGAIQPE